jgi:hypothetical protein
MAALGKGPGNVSEIAARMNEMGYRVAAFADVRDGLAALAKVGKVVGRDGVWEVS